MTETRAMVELVTSSSLRFQKLGEWKIFLNLSKKEVGTYLGIHTKARAVFFKLGLAQSREDPSGLTKCLGLLKIGPHEVLFKLFEFSRQKYFKI